MSIYLCKLTDQNNRTHGGFQWTQGLWAPKLSGQGGLCGPGWYHCYEHPLLAHLFNPANSNIPNPKLWSISVKGEPLTDNGLKRGYPSMRLDYELQLPELTTNQRIAFSILCALQVYNEPDFVEWAESWLSDKDRTEQTARTVANIIFNHMVRTTDPVAEAVAKAAFAAAYAVVLYNTVYASATHALITAYTAALRAADTGSSINAIDLAKQSLTYL